MCVGVFIYGDVELGIGWRRGYIWRRNGGLRQDCTEDGEKLVLLTFFYDRVDGAGGRKRRYYGGSVGAVVCIFGVGRVGGGVVMEVRGK